ncbi:restriction endonuclease subunit S (plasmid) [Komagataeibacter oboediens]|uniref:restriction endonuclease subunit S n=1 Tax=Komagataeibacter oboediens TaxID=65958 RepID=UPI0023D981C9|nr:restriction endonuclease subunit S [Komagataeibacter oboediens]WEQ54080.1 restriction endonuclease subunit S [Komagataeibacter oboediens]WEQ54136.1 restriction endonuclease subunit S [Komagataeibacter oboediens]
MLPEGWRKASLEDVAEIRSGIARSQKRVENPITLPYLRVANVQDGYLDLTEIRTIEINKAKIDRFSLHIGDVLMNEGGDFDKLGRGDVWRGQITPCLHQNHVFAVRPDQKILDSYFLANLSASAYGKGYFLSCAKRSTNLASINSTQLKQFPVLLPPLPEQKKIATILSTWDRAIEVTEKLLANSQQQKKALMQQLLTGKKRLPGFTGEWDIKRINEISDRIKRTSDGKKHPILMISSSIGFVTQDTKYSRYMAGESVKKYILLEEGEFAYNKGNSKIYQFGCVFELRQYKQGLVPNVYVCFKIKEEQCSEFYRHLFKFDFLKPQLRAIVNSGIRNNGLLNIKPDQFMNTWVPTPPSPEQKAIAAVLTTADEEITAIESDLTRLRQEKKALLQQLLTGKRRVKVD